MITRRTKIQLIVFALITMVGVAIVGAKYARLDRLVVRDSYEVVAHFPDSGGVFEAAEVTYRGVTVGRVGELRLTEEGVDVVLQIDNDDDEIPADALAVVGNRSAVGEQYVELQPQSDAAPYLEDGSQIAMADTRIPIAPTQWVLDVDRLFKSVNRQSLRVTVAELGAAFNGTGEDLSTIIDSSSAFIEAANDNFELTSKLLRESQTVLQTQVDETSAIREFSRNLALVTDTLVGSERDFIRVIESGSATANQLRTFLEENQVDLGELINSLVTTGEVTIRHMDGIRQVLVLYPHVVAGAYSVVSKSPGTGLFDAHFGLILAQQPPVCVRGYEGTDRRPPQSGENRPMAANARCTEPPTQSNARGAQNAPPPRAAPFAESRAVATYDQRTGEVTFTDAPEQALTYTGGVPEQFGEDSWKWTLLQPLVAAP